MGAKIHFYLFYPPHTDHLGSTSLTTDATGNPVYEARYDPFGAARWQSGSAVTDFDFTAQRLDGFGLHDYNARKNRPEGFSKSTLPAEMLFCKVAVSKSRFVKPFGSSSSGVAFNLPGSCSETKLLEL